MTATTITGPELDRIVRDLAFSSEPDADIDEMTDETMRFLRENGDRAARAEVRRRFVAAMADRADEAN